MLRRLTDLKIAIALAAGIVGFVFDRLEGMELEELLELEPEDLTQISGLGAASAQRLNEAGINSFAQLAALTPEEAFEITTLCVREILQRAIVAHQAEAAAKHIEITTELSEGEPMIEADSDGLTTIFGNLISNAIKYTPEGGSVTVRLQVADDHALVEFEDTGIGISPKHHARIFERFYRVDTARSREMGGTGLGLAIVKHLAQAFGGGVSLRSEIGSGSCFRVHLPLAMASQPSPLSS